MVRVRVRFKVRARVRVRVRASDKFGSSACDGGARHSSYVECRVVATTSRDHSGTGGIKVSVGIKVRVKGSRVRAFAAHSGSYIEFRQNTALACWICTQYGALCMDVCLDVCLYVWARDDV